jgi:hypothetical protein
MLYVKYWKMTNKLKQKIFIIIGIIILWLIAGCADSGPVKGIAIVKFYGNGAPTGPFEALSDPHPTGQSVFQSGDKSYVILSVNENQQNPITFSRYTFYNQKTEQEVDFGSSKDFDSWEAGQIDLINSQNPWNVPEQPGKYELRIYLVDKITASAVFRVE